jgi:formylglycine-generating enzyme required for sulfatase activity
LPSEAEWEYVSRADSGQAYPWGNEFDPDKMNTDPNVSVAAVGCFRRGASLFNSIEDLMGWHQWTRSGYRGWSVPYDPHDGREEPGLDDDYVLRGGNAEKKPIHFATEYREPSFCGPQRGFRVSIGPPVARSSRAVSMRQRTPPVNQDVC